MNNGRILNANDQPIKCQKDKNVTEMTNEEKKGNFSKEQTSGAFLSDYMGFWFLPLDSASCIKKNLKIFFHDHENLETTPTITIITSIRKIITMSISTVKPKKIISEKEANCTTFYKNVKVARITDAHPEWVIRNGYVYSESDNLFEVGNLFYDLYLKFINTLSDDGNDSQVNSSMKIVEAYTKREGTYSYRSIQDEFVNKNGIVKMRFDRCLNISFAIFAEMSEKDISEVEPENDWSKDFDHLNNGQCEEWKLVQVSGKNNKYPLMGPGSKPNNYDFILPANHQKNGLQIGVFADNGPYPTEGQLRAHEYFYGIHDKYSKLPMRPHYDNETFQIERAEIWGRYIGITPTVDIYTKARKQRIKVSFLPVHYQPDVANYLIKFEDAKALDVKPEMRQQVFFCDKVKNKNDEYGYKIYTNRFWPVQMIDAIDEDGKKMTLIFPEKTRAIIKGDCTYYYWPRDNLLDPDKIYLKDYDCL